MFNWFFGKSLSFFEYLFLIIAVELLVDAQYLDALIVAVIGVAIQMIGDKLVIKEKGNV